MWYPATTTTAPTGAALDLDRAKEFLRVDGTDDDDTIADAIASAVGHIEAYTATRMLTQTVALRAGCFDNLASLPIGPVRSIVSIVYLDPLGAQQTLDPTKYELFGAGLDRGIRPSINMIWPSTRHVSDAVLVTAVVGYGAEADIPTPVMRAILLLVGDYYLSREDTILQRGVTPATLPNGVDANLCNHRIFG